MRGTQPMFTIDLPSLAGSAPSTRVGVPTWPDAPSAATRGVADMEGQDTVAVASFRAGPTGLAGEGERGVYADDARPRESRDRHRYSARSPLFRAQALAAYGRGERAASVLRVTTVSRWMLLLALALIVLGGVAAVSLGRIEEVSVARGVLRSPFGVQPVVALVGGTVLEVTAQPGTRVKAAQVLARLDATPLRANLEEAEQRHTAIEAQWNQDRAAAEATHAHAARLLQTRLALLERLERRQARRVARRETRWTRLRAPELDRYLEQAVRDDTLEALEGARDEQLRLSEEISTLRMQVAKENATHAQLLTDGTARVEEARTRRNAAALVLRQAELRSPVAGRLESLRVQPGQIVQASEWVARIVRDEVPRSVIAFVPERDRAFLRVGSEANLEIDQLPLVEFGVARGRVERIASELADASELATALGDAAPRGPHVRVEITLESGKDMQRMQPYLRPGTLLTARIMLRRRRLLAIVFEPMRRWISSQ